MVQTPIATNVLYPDSDGKPMAENTIQYRWIVRLVTNLKRLLKDDVAFVAGDLLWYPVLHPLLLKLQMPWWHLVVLLAIAAATNNGKKTMWHRK